MLRNRIKRQLRSSGGPSSTGCPASDYVLIVRPGLAGGRRGARGFDWLGERVDEVLGKAAA